MSVFVGTVIANANRFADVGRASDQARVRGWRSANSNLAGETFEAASNFSLPVIIAFCMVPGVLLESLAMPVLTIPVAAPIAIGLNWDLIRFGIIIVIVLEMGMINPSVGINVFAVKSIVPKVPMGRIFRGIRYGRNDRSSHPFPQFALFPPQTVVGG